MSLRVWRHPTTKEGGAGPRRAEPPGGERGLISRPSFHYLAEDDDDEQTPGGLNRLVSRDAEGTQWTRKKVTVVDSGAAENVMPRSMFPETRIRETDRSKSGKGFKGPGGEHIKNHGQQVMTVRTPEGFCAQEHVAGRRREEAPGVSIAHHPSRGTIYSSGWMRRTS